jgi:hypothetical protein
LLLLFSEGRVCLISIVGDDKLLRWRRCIVVGLLLTAVNKMGSEHVTVVPVEDQVDHAVDTAVEDDQKVAGVGQEVQQKGVRLEKGLNKVNDEGLSIDRLDSNWLMWLLTSVLQQRNSTTTMIIVSVSSLF